jgi:hypothetical protein
MARKNVYIVERRSSESGEPEFAVVLSGDPEPHVTGKALLSMIAEHLDIPLPAPDAEALDALRLNVDDLKSHLGGWMLIADEAKDRAESAEGALGVAVRERDTLKAKLTEAEKTSSDYAYNLDQFRASAEKHEAVARAVEGVGKAWRHFKPAAIGLEVFARSLDHSTYHGVARAIRALADAYAALGEPARPAEPPAPETHDVTDLYTEPPTVMEISGERAEVLEALEDVVNQACGADGHLDSMALSAYAAALRLLARLGRVTIRSEAGRRVIGEWVKEATNGQA